MRYQRCTASNCSAFARNPAKKRTIPRPLSREHTTLVDRVLYVPITSYEEVIGADPHYHLSAPFAAVLYVPITSYEEVTGADLERFCYRDA